MESIVELKVDSITIDTQREVSAEKINDLANSITKIGLMHPVTVVKSNNDKYTLVSGYHRLQAFKSLGIDKIPAVCVDYDEDRVKLARIDENLVRKRLTKLEFSKILVDRKELESKLEGSEKNFVKKIKDMTGDSSATVSRAMKIGKSIDPTLANELVKTSAANNQNSLLELSLFDLDEQNTLAEALKSTDDSKVKSKMVNDKIAEKRKDNETKKKSVEREPAELKSNFVKEVTYDNLNIRTLRVEEANKIKDRATILPLLYCFEHGIVKVITSNEEIVGFIYGILDNDNFNLIGVYYANLEIRVRLFEDILESYTVKVITPSEEEEFYYNLNYKINNEPINLEYSRLTLKKN